MAQLPSPPTEQQPWSSDSAPGIDARRRIELHRQPQIARFTAATSSID
jgi:hypothetical protein